MSKKEREGARGFGPEECMIRIELPSSPREIVKVESFLLEANAKLRLDDGTMYRLLVAVTEAVNNAIIHGNGSDPSKMVIICITATPQMVSVTVQDHGPGFDSANLPNPLDQENLLKDHGRGVFLIRSLMDKVEFSRTEKGSAITMVVDLNLLR